jgi:hypothetical protein
VKRRRSSAPGRRGPDGRKLPLILLAAIAVALSACGQATSTNEPTASEQPAATDPGTPSGTVETPSGAPASEQPTATAEPTTPDPAATPTSEPEDGASPNPGSAAACTGSDENRDFFASMAAAVDWTVYCPVLPDGWFVDDGQYRLANGGWMRISYEGPGDAGVLLQQGVFCTESDGCVPAGREVGATAFGDRSGTLAAGDDGGWSIVVDRGAAPSWLLVVTGLGETDARSIAADLLPIAD